MSDYLRPFWILTSKDDPKAVEVPPFYVKNSRGVEVECKYLRECDSDLLEAIDQDNVQGVQEDLQKDHLSADLLYVIPRWELPEAENYQTEPLLHRALWSKLTHVFESLLKAGANPRRLGYLGRDTIERTFERYHLNNDAMLCFGKMLIEAGVTGTEIKKAINDPALKIVRKALLYYAKEHEQRHRVSLQKLRNLFIRQDRF